VILAATLASLPDGDAQRAWAATVVVLLVGVTFAAAGALKLGALASFISRPVLRGFAFGLAVTIILGQAPALAGVTVASRELGPLVLGLATSLPHWNPWSLGLGLASLLAILFLRRFPALPAPLVVPAWRCPGRWTCRPTAWPWSGPSAWSRAGRAFRPCRPATIRGWSSSPRRWS
jgi:MFS superfamily sulfate permease-like transporter